MQATATVPIRRLIPIGEVELCVWEWPGRDPPVVLCHATGFHGRCWDPVVEHLPDRHIYAPDLRGHGGSSKHGPPCHWRAFGEDIARLAGTLDIAGATGAGHSMGGHAVTLAAALAPGAFSRLVLFDPVIRPPGAYGSLWAGAEFVERRRNHWKSPEEMYERFRSRPPFQSWRPAALRSYCDHALAPAAEDGGFLLACPPAIEADIYRRSSELETNIRAEIGRITIPVRVVRCGVPKELELTGPGDSPTDPGLAGAFQKGEDVHLIDASHFFPMEAPEAAARLLK